MKIFIVEDEARTRNGLQKLIEKLDGDYMVAGTADNGEDGLREIRRTDPDLVIADIKMPRMNGLAMIGRLKEEHMRQQVVLLSGYADFEYAQKAIRCGVIEYLLKPITVEDLAAVLNKARNRFYEQAVSLYSELTPEALVSEILSGRMQEKEAVISVFSQKFNFQRSEKNSLLTAVVHMAPPCRPDAFEQIRARFAGVLGERPGASGAFVELEGGADFFAVVAGLPCTGDGKALFQKFLDACAEQDASASLGRADGPEALAESMKTLRKRLELVKLTGEKIIDGDTRAPRPGAPFAYPKKIETECVRAVYDRDSQGFRAKLEEFVQFCRTGCEDAEEINEAFLRFSSSVLDVLQENDPEQYSRINKGYLFHLISSSVTWKELTRPLEILRDLGDKASAGGAKPYSLVVQKVLNFISQHYAEDFSLDGLAENLHVTSEYLSSIFRREVGETYKCFLNRYRIGKAKELFLTTNLKSYEVACKTGYRDPKYFTSVFKKITGASPSEYVRIFSRAQ